MRRKGKLVQMKKGMYSMHTRIYKHESGDFIRFFLYIPLGPTVIYANLKDELVSIVNMQYTTNLIKYCEDIHKCSLGINKMVDVMYTPHVCLVGFFM